MPRFDMNIHWLSEENTLAKRAILPRDVALHLLGLYDVLLLTVTIFLHPLFNFEVTFVRK